MMALADFSPVTTTMENITASGEFDLITDVDLRKMIISVYNSFNTTLKLEKLIADYVDEYLTPFLINNLRFRDFSPLNNDFIGSSVFENIVYGYEALLQQQISGYEKNLSKLQLLNKKLTITDK
jgi:hypothetical protein